MNELLQHLANLGLIDGSGNIMLEIYSTGCYQAVDVETFESLFGGILNDPEVTDKYSALVAADEGKGYARFFDAWHTAGIL